MKPFVINSIIMGVGVIWFFIMRTVWRARLFERFLGLDKGRA